MYDIIFELHGTEVIITHQSEELYTKGFTVTIGDDRFNVKSVGCPAIIGKDIYLRGSFIEENFKPILYLNRRIKYEIRVFMIGIYAIKSSGFNVGFMYNKKIYSINIDELKYLILNDNSNCESFEYFWLFLNNVLRNIKSTVCKL